MSKEENKELGIWISDDEVINIEKKLSAISDFQRLSSVLIWIGIAMVLLHIMADIFFHVIQ